MATLWTIFAITSISNIWTFALGYNYSPHEHGTVKDVDFWSLLENTTTQLFGVVTAAIPLWSRKNISNGLAAGLIAFAVVTTILAVPLYLKAPTEWSQIFAMMGASVQAFMMLQLVLVGASMISASVQA